MTREGSLHEVGVKELKVCAAQTLDIESGDVVVDMDTLGSGIYSLPVPPYHQTVQYLFIQDEFQLRGWGRD